MVIDEIIKKILTEEGNKIIKLFQDSMEHHDKVVTGRGKNSIKPELKGMTELQIVGFQYVLDQEFRRKKSASELQGADFFQQIKQWTIARGIPETATASIVNSIKKRGYSPKELSPGLITDPGDELVKRIQARVAIELSKNLANNIFNTYGNINK